MDTDKLLINELAGRFGNVGFDVLAATDVDTALKLIEVANPSVILLDLSMKTPDGKEFLTLLKSKSTLTDVPIIILSQDADIHSQVYGFLQGASDYIVKPFQFAEVLMRVNNQIRTRNIQKELKEKTGN